MWSRKIILFSVITLLVLFGVSNPAALAQTPTGSFDLNTIPTNHSSILTITDNSKRGGGLTSITATVNVAPAGAPISVVLQEQPDDEGVFKSTFVKFKTAGASQSSPNPPELVVAIGNTISVKYPAGVTEIDTATIFSPATSYFTNTIPSSYNVLKTMTQQLVNCAGVVPTTDSDQDGICDVWETANGLNVVLPASIGGGSYSLSCNVNATYDNDLTGATVCPIVGIRDVYVEIDYMVGHRPNQDAINQVVKAFFDNGIHLHVIVDKELLFHTDLLKFPGNTVTNKGYDYIKSKELGTDFEKGILPSDAAKATAWTNTNWKAKMQVFYYYLWAHKQFSGTEASGISEAGGNDGGVTLGAFDGSVGSQDQQAGTFMHELGHNFNLDHGGDETNTDNCKPTLLSVMNYIYQFDDFGVSRPLEYSRFAILSPGIESDLDGTTSTIPGYGSTDRLIVHGIGGGQTTTKVIPGDVTWPAAPNWQYIRTISDSKNPPNVVCAAPIIAVDLSSSNQWAFIDLVTKNSHWREGRGSVEPTSGPISLSTDYNQYSIGDIITVTGTVSPIATGDVLIQVVSPNANVITIGQLGVNPATGKFETTLTPGGLWNPSIPGEFTIKATYNGAVTSVPISITDVSFIIPEDKWCITKEEVQAQKDEHEELNMQDAPLCTSDEITIQNVRAARSVNVDNLIGKINLLDNSDYTNQTSRELIISAPENIRTLVLSDRIIEAVTSYTDLKSLIERDVVDSSKRVDLLTIIDRSIRPLTPQIEPPEIIPGGEGTDDYDNDGVIFPLDQCPKTPLGDRVDENGCTVRPTDYRDIVIIILIIIIIILLVILYIQNRKNTGLKKSNTSTPSFQSSP